MFPAPYLAQDEEQRVHCANVDSGEIDLSSKSLDVIILNHRFTDIDTYMSLMDIFEFLLAINNKSV